MIAIPPLLHKELVELAAARRTYVLRMVVALGFLGLFVLVAAPQLRRLAAGDVGVLGSGGELFRYVVGWAFLAIYLFLPLLLVPSVTIDEERGNLELMRVAGLEERDYLIQKLASRLLAVGGLLLLALPLAGLAYTLGGIGAGELMGTILCLLMALIQVGAVSLSVATSVRTTDQAAWQAHLRVAYHLFLRMPFFHLPLLIAGWVACALLGGGSLAMYWSIQPVGLWLVLMSDPGGSLLPVLVGGIPILVAGGLYFRRAMESMVNRELERRRDPFAEFWPRRPGARHGAAPLWPPAWLRHWFGSRHERVLPEDDGLAWRELMNLPLLRFEHLTVWPLLVALPILPLFLASVFNATSWQEQAGRLHLWSTLVVVAGGLALVPLAAGLMGSERRRASLEVLLVTPLSTRDMLVGKLAGCRRVIAVVWILSMLLAALASLLGLADPGAQGVVLVLFPLCHALGLGLALSTLMWLGLLVGMMLRQPTHAVGTTMVLVVAWCWLPGILAPFLPGGALLHLLDPLELLHAINGLQMDGSAASEVLEVLGIDAVLWLLLRQCSLHLADRLLGRT